MHERKSHVDWISQGNQATLVAWNDATDILRRS